MTRINLFYFFAAALVFPLAMTFERYCRWTDRRWPPGAHAKPRNGRHSSAYLRHEAGVGSQPEAVAHG